MATRLTSCFSTALPFDHKQKHTESSAPHCASCNTTQHFCAKKDGQSDAHVADECGGCDARKTHTRSMRRVSEPCETLALRDDDPRDPRQDLAASATAPCESLVHTEWIDPCGLREANRGLTLLRAKWPSMRSRLEYLRSYLREVDLTYGPVQTGPRGHAARALSCTYRRVRGGRMYSASCRLAPARFDGPRQHVCVQNMPNVLRRFLLRKWGRDLDVENCHVSLMYQLGKFYHKWPEHVREVAPLALKTMEHLYSNRHDFIERVANAHGIESDEERYVGFRKDMVKPLLLRVLYGGSYDKWIDEHGYCAHKSQLVLQLQREIEELRRAVIESERFRDFVECEREYQRQRGRRGVAAERGIFSKVAQHLESTVLLSMRAYLIASGWKVSSLIHDGLIVEHQDGSTVDLDALCAYVERDTQFTVRVVEKMLFSDEPPKLDTLLK
jgi:hypothetical protein